MVKRRQALSEAAKLTITLASLLAIQMSLFAFPPTRILVGSMLPIDPFSPWIPQFFLIVLTSLFLLIAVLSWSIHLHNKQAEGNRLSIRMD